MQKLIIQTLTAVGTLLLFLIPAACSSGLSNTPPAAYIPTSPPESTATPPQNTEFARMLGNIPYSFLAQQDIWFSDPAKAKELYGIQNAGSYTEVMQLPEQRQMFSKLSSIAFPEDGIRIRYDLAKLVGFDDWMADRLVFPSNRPPRTFSFKEGDFDKALIDSKLTEQGYGKVNYHDAIYYAVRGDFEADLDSELPKIVLAALNRIAILDNTVITAPSTEILTAILDSMAGTNKSMLDNPAVQALTSSLDEVLSGVIMSPERLIAPVFSQPADFIPFNFIIPENWGRLHQYELIGMGYKESGPERLWTISLFYADAQTASQDAATLVNRMNSYNFNTNMQVPDVVSTKNLGTALTAEFEIGEPRVQAYPRGATLTLDCRFKPQTGSQAWLKHTQFFHDLLFLAPDPAPYVKAPSK